MKTMMIIIIMIIIVIITITIYTKHHHYWPEIDSQARLQVMGWRTLMLSAPLWLSL